MDKGVRGWIKNTASKNFWRVAEYYEFEDLVQDGGLVYARIVSRYPGLNQKQLMALFKTAYINHIHDLSKKASRIEYVREAEMPHPLAFLLEGEDADQDPDFAFIIRQLPASIARVISRMNNEGRGHPFRRRPDLSRETSNERACRLAGGLDPSKRDIREAVRAYLSGAKLHPQYD